LNECAGEGRGVEGGGGRCRREIALRHPFCRYQRDGEGDGWPNVAGESRWFGQSGEEGMLQGTGCEEATKWG
jgi:hypothetical protein